MITAKISAVYLTDASSASVSCSMTYWNGTNVVSLGDQVFPSITGLLTAATANGNIQQACADYVNTTYGTMFGPLDVCLFGGVDAV